MPLGDGKAKKEAQEISSELKLILDAVSSIGDTLVSSLEESIDSVSGLNNAVDIVSKTIKRGFVADLKESVKNTDLLIGLQTKANQGILKASEVEKAKAKILANEAKLNARIAVIKKQGGKIDEEAVTAQREQIKNQLQQLDALEKNNLENEKTFGLIDLAKSSLKSVANKLDESGKLSKILDGNLNAAQRNTLILEAGFAILVKGMFQASDNIANIAKNTGVSADEAQRLQTSFALTALDSDKLFITSTSLNKSFAELTAQTGLIADFGGQTLITQTTLTKQLGLSVEAAGKLSLLSRIQSENTEGVLDTTVATVGAISKQNGVALNSKAILDEISNVSAAIAVSLGKNPVELAKAASEAKLFGANLATVDAIASSLLDFENSITKELEAELLIGKDINLENARRLALNNDLAGLSKELADNEAIIEAFATGNRIQQEAAAAAIGLSRDQLAEIALQQEFNNLSAEQFRDTYGDVTYEQLQSQSASEKFASALEQIQSIIGDIGIAFAPILNGFASLVGFIAQSKVAAGALAGVLIGIAAIQTTLAIKSLIQAYASIFSGSFMAGPFGLPIALASAAALGGLIAGVSSMAKADDMVAPPGYGDRILSTPKGSIALNNQDTVVAGTNLGGSDNREARRTNALLEQILTKQGTVKIDSVQAGTAFAMNTYQVQ